MHKSQTYVDTGIEMYTHIFERLAQSLSLWNLHNFYDTISTLCVVWQDMSDVLWYNSHSMCCVIHIMCCVLCDWIPVRNPCVWQIFDIFVLRWIFDLISYFKNNLSYAYMHRSCTAVACNHCGSWIRYILLLIIIPF